jgi:hypothetical protein
MIKSPEYSGLFHCCSRIKVRDKPRIKVRDKPRIKVRDKPPIGSIQKYEKN